ncbi:hypothetical protein, partial [Pseudomonas cremoris]|uniref:hypothetical protein n=1 Tax=Pseudomonas cremoris TaxID=2724178 RepID=UPI001E4EC707
TTNEIWDQTSGAAVAACDAVSVLIGDASHKASTNTVGVSTKRLPHTGLAMLLQLLAADVFVIFHWGRHPGHDIAWWTVHGIPSSTWPDPSLVRGRTKTC